MDTIQMPFNGRIGKDYVVYMKNEMILSHKKRIVSVTYTNTDRTRGHHVN